MGLFRKSEIERLEAEAQTNPTPAALTALAERYLAGGEVDRALETAKRAADQFPDSSRARTTYQSIRKLQLQAHILELQKKIGHNPIPTDYERLADIYCRELGNRDRALEVVREGLERFPKSEGLHYLDGQVRLDRFHEEFIARDGQKCIDHLREATHLNPQNFKAWLLLARLYGEIGMSSAARACVTTLHQLAPYDDLVRALEQAVARPAAFTDIEEALRAVEAQGGLSPEGQTVAAVFGAKAAAPPVPVGAEEAHGLVKGLLGRPWALGAFAFTTAGQSLAHESRPPLDGNAWQDVLLTLHRNAEDASRRMDIGSFLFGTLDCPHHRVHLRERGALVLALVVQPSARADEVDAELERAAEGL